jgi:hypothetical protein
MLLYTTNHNAMRQSTTREQKETEGKQRFFVFNIKARKETLFLCLFSYAKELLFEFLLVFSFFKRNSSYKA